MPCVYLDIIIISSRQNNSFRVIVRFCPVPNRIERIEFLDEVDLLHQLLSHYCIAWAVNDAAQLGEQNLLYLALCFLCCVFMLEKVFQTI